MQIKSSEKPLAGYVKVYFNDRPVIDAIEASDDEGWIRIPYRDKNGRPVREGGVLATKKLFGDVVLCLDAQAPPAIVAAYEARRRGHILIH